MKISELRKLIREQIKEYTSSRYYVQYRKKGEDEWQTIKSPSWRDDRFGAGREKARMAASNYEKGHEKLFPWKDDYNPDDYEFDYNKIDTSRSMEETINEINGKQTLTKDNFDSRLKSMMGADDFKKATNPKLSKLINNAIMSIDPDMSYKDFAKGVAQVLIDEYGTHNYEPFISELKKALDSTLG